MYLQVAHYYDQKAQTPAAIIHALIQESTKNPGREKPVKTKTRAKKCYFFIPSLLH